MFYDDPSAGLCDSEIDWEEVDRQNQEREYRLKETFWWLTDRERHEFLPKVKGYPGGDADCDQLDKFARLFRNTYSRRVPCKFLLGFVTVSGEFDLIGGDAFIIEDGRYKLAEDFMGEFSIEFKGKRNVSIYNASWFYGTAKDLSKYDVQNVLDELSKAGKLPALRKI